MKISSLQNYHYNNLRFSGSGSPPINVDWRTQYEPQNIQQENNPQNESKIPEWLRKSTLFGLIALAIANDPVTKNYFKSGDDAYEENIRSEYFEDIARTGNTEATHHLNQLGDIDITSIQSNNNGNYHIKIKLDNDNIDFRLYVPEAGKNELNGTFKINNSRTLGYKAIFNPENPNEFEVYVRNKENKKYIIGRTEKGELYRLVGNKKIILNSENVKKYQKKLEDIENKSFFSAENETWRNTYFILLFLLTLNEWGHDLERKERKENNAEE